LLPVRLRQSQCGFSFRRRSVARELVPLFVFGLRSTATARRRGEKTNARKRQLIISERTPRPPKPVPNDAEDTFPAFATFCGGEGLFWLRARRRDAGRGILIAESSVRVPKILASALLAGLICVASFIFHQIFRHQREKSFRAAEFRHPLRARRKLRLVERYNKYIQLIHNKSNYH
jgi:hypothetical protein